MKVINTENEFVHIDSKIDNAIEKSKILPDKIFRSVFKYFLFITFDELFMILFFNHLKEYLIQVGEKGFWMSIIDPDPKGYFFKNFGFFGSFEFLNSDSENNYVSALNEFPYNSPADAPMHNSNSLVFSSFINNWVIYGNRDADIAICAFLNGEEMKIFKSIYGSDLLGEVNAAAEYAFGTTPKAEEFCKNYSLN